MSTSSRSCQSKRHLACFQSRGLQLQLIIPRFCSMFVKKWPLKAAGTLFSLEISITSLFRKLLGRLKLKFKVPCSHVAESGRKDTMFISDYFHQEVQFGGLFGVFFPCVISSEVYLFIFAWLGPQIRIFFWEAHRADLAISFLVNHKHIMCWCHRDKCKQRGFKTNSGAAWPRLVHMAAIWLNCQGFPMPLGSVIVSRQCFFSFFLFWPIWKW